MSLNEDTDTSTKQTNNICFILKIILLFQAYFYVKLKMSSTHAEICRKLNHTFSRCFVHGTVMKAVSVSHQRGGLYYGSATATVRESHVFDRQQGTSYDSTLRPHNTFSTYL